MLLKTYFNCGPFVSAHRYNYVSYPELYIFWFREQCCWYWPCCPTFQATSVSLLSVVAARYIVPSLSPSHNRWYPHRNYRYQTDLRWNNELHLRIFSMALKSISFCHVDQKYGTICFSSNICNFNSRLCTRLENWTCNTLITWPQDKIWQTAVNILEMKSD